MGKDIRGKLPIFGLPVKLLISFLVVSSLPLLILGYVAHRNLDETGSLAASRAEEMGAGNLKSAEEIGKTAIEDSVRALDEKSTQAIELRTIVLAREIAGFLHERDKDILILASIEPDPSTYLAIYTACRRSVTLPEEKHAGADGDMPVELPSTNPENSESWRHRPPLAFKQAWKPLYKEITFLDLNGRERIKIKDGKVSDELIDAGNREETRGRAEDYFSHLGSLQRGEIYVSRVIGPYVGGRLEKTVDGLKVAPGSAFAGKENPRGERFEGIVRWATPVYDAGGDRRGYVTMALDHTHIMEFTDHVLPTEEGFSELSNAGSGNYAFIWDDRDRCIAHPRHFFICGYDPRTGEEVPGWVSEETYGEYLKSGMNLREFIEQLPSFRNFTQKKQGSAEQMRAGNISLDCRVLDTAPQCQGWHEGTEDGGAGSFLIYWSGLWKLTTYAAIPYHTGVYGKSKRGFGYVTIGANVDEFHKMANTTRANIETSILKQSKDIESTTVQTRQLIRENLIHNRNMMTLIMVISILAVICASTLISLRITRPIRRLTDAATAISRGDLDQAIPISSRDEIGRLAQSFNEMVSAVAEVDQMKSEFVSIASHELRTPIQAMLLGVSGILEGYSGEIDEEVREDLQLAKEGIERLMRLVKDLLDLSRIEARKIELIIGTTSVAEIIGRAVEEVSDLAPAHDHIIVQEIHRGVPDVEVDKDRMIQVIINLLSNSIKYTPDGGKIIVRVEASDEDAVFSVVDNGYGIPLWAHEEVFRKFFQADSIMSQRAGGCGLGLTIARGIVEEHGGTISCESPVPDGRFPGLLLGNERKGAAFIVRLPVHGRALAALTDSAHGS